MWNHYKILIMRARNLKPGFFCNEDLAECDFATRILFLGLISFADREGRFEWRPKKIKACIFPYDNGIDINQMLCNLMSLQFITKYEIDGKSYGIVVNFYKHQKPHPHEAKSTLPAPPENLQKYQCHDMSLNVSKCKPESLNLCSSESLNPDIGVNTPIVPESGDEFEKSPKMPPCPQAKIIDLYHETLPELSRVEEWPSSSENHLRARWRSKKERQNLEWWREFFQFIRASPFLMGEIRDFKADLIWIVREYNFAKILNGNYHHEKNGPKLSKATLKSIDNLRDWVAREEEERPP